MEIIGILSTSASARSWGKGSFTTPIRIFFLEIILLPSLLSFLQAFGFTLYLLYKILFNLSNSILIFLFINFIFTVSFFNCLLMNLPAYKQFPPPAVLSNSSFIAKPFIKYSLISAVAHFLKCTPL